MKQPFLEGNKPGRHMIGKKRGILRVTYMIVVFAKENFVLKKRGIKISFIKAQLFPSNRDTKQLHTDVKLSKQIRAIQFTVSHHRKLKKSIKLKFPIYKQGIAHVKSNMSQL